METFAIQADPPPREIPVGRSHIVAACLTILAREAQTAGVTREQMIEVMRDAPDRIDAALTRGKSCLVLYRLDPKGVKGIVSDRDDRLEAFSSEAIRDDAPLLGLNPTMVAEMAAGIVGSLTLQQEGIRLETPTLH